MRLFLVSNVNRALLITLNVPSNPIQLSRDPTANLVLILLFNILSSVPTAAITRIEVLFGSLVPIPVREMLSDTLVIKRHHALKV